MTTIHLGPNNTAPCNLDTLLETKLLLQANSGGGKSFACRRLLEQTHEHVQQLVFDVEGDFATLRERFDYVLVAKDGGDCVADPRTAPAVLRKLLELRCSAILDISELKPPERIAFVNQGLRALVDAPKTLWHPALVVLDEAQLFCPQKREVESSGAVEDFQARSRKRGFGIVLATPRLAEFSKTVSDNCNNRLIGRCVEDVDRKRAGDALGFAAAQRRDLRSLKPGEFFAVGPAFGDDVERIKIGPVATTHPRPGTRTTSLPPARKGPAKALAQLAAIVPPEPEPEKQRDQAVGDDPALLDELDRLRARVAELEAQPPVPEHLVAALQTAVDRMHESAIGATHAARDVMAALPGYARRASSSSVHPETAKPEETAGYAGAALPVRSNDTSPRRARSQASRDAGLLPSNGEASEASARSRAGKSSGILAQKRPGELSKCARSLLTALAQHGDLSLYQAAVIAGYAPKSGGVAAAASELRQGDYATGANAQLSITAKGRTETADDPKLPRGRKLAEYWISTKLDRCEGILLSEVLAAYPNKLSLKEAATRAGYAPASGGVAAAAGKLRMLTLVHGPNAGMVADRRLV